MAKSGTCTYNPAQLCSEKSYIIRNTQYFLNILNQQEPLLPNKECVLYHLESLFTNLLIQETIDYILNEIYVKDELPKICSKLIFRHLLLQLTTKL